MLVEFQIMIVGLSAPYYCCELTVIRMKAVLVIPYCEHNLNHYQIGLHSV